MGVVVGSDLTAIRSRSIVESGLSHRPELDGLDDASP
jgi:hypothetical protein